MEFEITLIKDSPYPKSFTGELIGGFKLNLNDENFDKPLSELEKEY